MPLAPLVFGEAAGEIAGQQRRGREVPMRLDQIGLQHQGGLARCHRRREIAARG